MSKPRFTLGDLLLAVSLVGLVAAVVAPAIRSIRAAGGDTVRSLAVSADGSTAAALCDDGTVRVWKTQDGTLAATLPTGADDYSHLGLSGDGAMVAVSENQSVAGAPRGGIEVWDVASQQRLRTLAAPAACEIAVAAEADWIAWADNGTVAVYDTKTEDAPATTLAAAAKGTPGGEYYQPMFSPDGELLAVRHSEGQVGQIVLFSIADHSILAKLDFDDLSYGAMAFSPHGRKLAVACAESYCEFEATRKVGRAWDFSTAHRRSANIDHDDWGYVHSLVYLPDGHTLAATCGRLLFIDTNTDRASESGVTAFLAAASCRGNVLISSDAEDVKLWDAGKAAVRQTLWRSSGVNWPLVLAGFLVWMFIFNTRKARKLVRLCHTCGRAFSPQNANDTSIECENCRQQAHLKTLPAGQARLKRWKQRLSGLANIVLFLVMLCWFRGSLSWDFAWLLLAVAVVPAWMAFAPLKSYVKRWRTTDERYDVRLAEHCASTCGETRRVGGIVVWSAAPSNVAGLLDSQVEVCRQRLQDMLGQSVAPLDGVRALIFADRRGMARYLAELRLPLGSGPRFSGVYLFSPLKKMLIAERELLEQIADPRVKLRSVLLYALLDQCDPRSKNAWSVRGLGPALARDNDDHELVRLQRRMKAAILAGRALGPGELFERRPRKTIRRLQRDGDLPLHLWLDQYQTQPWSLVEFLCGRGATPERRAAFQQFWSDPNRRRNPAACLTKQYGMSMDDLFREWRGWVERQPVGGHQLPPPHLTAWMLREPIATVANAAAVRRNRIVAIRHLGELGFALGADSLIDVLRGDDQLLRADAVWALECISGEVHGESSEGWDAWWQNLPEPARNGGVSTEATTITNVTA